MKNIWIILLVLGLFACEDNDVVFDASLSRENISFKEIPGGAVMYYTLPEDTDIFAVKAEYKDYQGKEMIKIASYAYDSLVLDGFNEARKDVPVRVSLLNQANEASKAIELTFNTQNSAPVAFFEKIEVLPYWDGFQIKYEVPTGTTVGLCDVFFMGTNPITQELDTLLLETFAIEPGKNIKYFSLAQRREKNTIIVKTEDLRGNMAMKKIYTDITSLNIEKLNPQNFVLLDPFNLSWEDDSENTRFGWKYLFDGDIKGTRKWEEGSDPKWGGATRMAMYTFFAGPNAVNTPEDPKYFILDIQEPMQVASFKLYAMLYLKYTAKPIIYKYSYGNRVPNWITVYASNDKDDPDSWVQIGEYYQSSTAAVPWAQRAMDVSPVYQLKSDAAFAAAEPCFVTINFSEENPAYRYFKIEFNGTSKKITQLGENTLDYVTLHELEVYGK